MTTQKIIALGFFDGVHLGHQALLRRCTALARQLGVQAAAITFDAHPQSLFAPDPPPLINTTADRVRLLGRYGISQVEVLPVTPETMGQPWLTFLQKLVENGAVGFVCGDDFRFGSHGAGNAGLLAQFCQAHQLPCIVIPEKTMDDVRISSTYIRRQIETGDMSTAVRFSGHPHILTGQVIPGQQLGRKLGFPTANLRLPEKLAVPKFGVYACVALVDGKRYAAVTNIGTRPTVEGHGITVEPWILDFSGNLYGQDITLEFYRFLRPEQKFATLEELKQEIYRNADQARQILKEVSQLPPCEQGKNVVE